MTMYVDLLFGLNTTLNYLLLRGSAAMGGCPAGVWRLLGAAALGGLYAVAAVLPGMALLQSIWFQVLSGTAMVWAAFGWKKSTVKQVLFFFALSFAFGGMVMLAVQTVEPDFVFLGGNIYYAVSTSALLLLAGISYGLAAVVLQGWGRYTGGDLVQMTLSLQEKTVTVKALRDTGNTLRDPVNGQDVPIASWQVLKELLPELALRQEDFDDPAGLLQRICEVYPQLRFRLITYGAVGVSSGLLPAVKCQVSQGAKPSKRLVAFTATEFSANGQYEVLVGGVST